MKGPAAGPEPILPDVNFAAAGRGDRVEPSPGLPFPVVGAGASAGGLPALTQMLHSVEPDTGMAFVVVQHLDPNHASMMSDILARETKMPVAEVTDGMGLEPDRVYVTPPGKSIALEGNLLRLAPRSEVRRQHRPIDYFLRSLAEQRGDRAIGVILSGIATDGTLGLQEVKAAGGITFAQDNTAEHSGMPRSAIASGCVDFVLPPDEIGAEITRISRHPYVASPPPAPKETVPPDTKGIVRVLEMLRQSAGVDFANYKRNTLNRRITRRMVLLHLEKLDDYVRFLQKDPGELDALYQDILINVTSFFRDPEAFEALKTDVFPHLTAEKSPHDPVRVWVLGCSTGEEAYSIAMAYAEYAEAAGCRVPMQIFATDLNGGVIDRARAGIYSRSSTQDLAPERLRRFFVEMDGHYRIAKPIRDMCVFARQNALADPPFSRMSLVACRNMLIYLEPVLQQQLIPRLHYALQPSGRLWLGNSETVGSFRDLFELTDARHKIYAPKSGSGRGSAQVLPGAQPRERYNPPQRLPERADASDQVREADRMVLARYAPAGVIVDANLNIVQFRGDTSPYLASPPGRPNLNLLKMLREGLLGPVRNALRKTAKSDAPVREEGLRVPSNGGYRTVSLVVLPFGRTEGSQGMRLLMFEEPAQRAVSRARNAESQARAILAKTAPRSAVTSAVRDAARLQNEVDELRDYLQALVGQHEATTEELQSANEEVQSANEELQSSNEELETSREEIQSANEELATVNDELQRRNNDLQQVNNDLVNLIGSVQMAIIMLGQDLRIRRFTPVAEKLLNLIPADVGRPLPDIRLKLLIPDLEAMLREVIESVTVREIEVQDADGRWHLLRIRPYRTLDNKIDGAVLALIDVDTIKRAEQDLRESARRKDDFLAMLSHELRTPLGALRSAAEVLNDRQTPPAGQEQARSVLERQTRNMARMVEDLLDVARISHGKIQLRPAPADLIAAVRHAVDTTQHDRAATSQKLTLSLPTRPVRIMADGVRIDQILVNLLHNASKFTPREGQIWVTVAADARMKDAGGFATPHGQAEVRVRDNGVGIDPAALPHVFSMFHEMAARPRMRARDWGSGSRSRTRS